ncbi:MAG: hypothetical protein IKG18_09515 [Atopobiaceae bacterium]|nr:hypothetical protein [Atopobiaceae bacterium]
MMRRLGLFDGSRAAAEGTTMRRPKAVLAGLLSVTTAGLLFPVVPTRVDASDGMGEVAGLESEAPEPPSAQSPDEGAGQAQDGFQLEEGIVPELLGVPRLGGEELVSGTELNPAAYESGDLAFAFRATSLPVSVTVCADAERWAVDDCVCADAEDRHEAETELEDGMYDAITLRIEDGSGAICEMTFEHVIVDTRPPVYEVAWSERGVTWISDGHAFVNEPCELVISVDEANPSDDLAVVLNGMPLECASEGAVRTYVVSCGEDGEYEIGITGTDALGRIPVCEGAGLELPLHLVVDAHGPVARVLYDGEELGPEDLQRGMLFTTARPQISIEVSDDNLDVSSLRVGGVVYETWRPTGSGVALELPEVVDLSRPLAITGGDKAGNTLGDGLCVVPVVVDTDAPTIEAEQVSPDVVAVNGDGASLFFADELAVRLTIRDEQGIAEVRVEPDGSCVCDDGGFVPGDTEATVTLTPEEGCALTSEITVVVRDLAGNWRTWSIAEEGVACASGSQAPSANAALYADDADEPRYPLMLLLDATAPGIEVRGVEEGFAYGGEQEVTISIDEAGFSYLRAYGGERFADQPVLVASIDGPNAGERALGPTPLLYVRDFAVNALSGRWEATARLVQDGSYTMESQLVDVAGNASARITRHVVVDATVPECAVSFVRDEDHAEEHEGSYYRTPRKAVVRVREHNWEDLRDFDLHYTTEDGRQHVVEATRFESVGGDWHSCEVEFAQDGTYQLCLDMTDVAGNPMTPYRSEQFSIDTVDPEISVTYEGAHAEHDGCWDGARTAVVRIDERNWGDDARYEVAIDVAHASAGDEPKVSAWRVPDASHPSVHECTVEAVQDGSYVLKVGGRDLAGRGAVYRDETGFVDSFVVDTQAPEVQVDFAPSSYTELDGVKYLNHAIDVPVVIRDRNLDSSQVTLTTDHIHAVGDERVRWDGIGIDEAGVVSRTKVVPFGHGRHVSPSVTARDLAGHEALTKGEPFVVDLEAPDISSVSTSEPSVAGYEDQWEGASGEVQFFDRPTRLEFVVEDDLALEGAHLYDPDGQYSLESDFGRGSSAARVAVQLTEGTGSRAADAYERNVVLTVADVAGNTHSWTLDRHGNVVADVVHEGADVTLGNAGTEPLALVQDSVAPTITVEGVVPGQVTNQSLVARVNVGETNFSYLRTFRPDEPVVRISSREASAARTQRVEEVSAASFEGEDPSWTYAKEFAADGHYAVSAFVTDVAGHPSNHVELGEFTIDKTAPVIQVAWDHDVDEAVREEGKYFFKTTRRATVTIREHNFRPADVTIDAGTAGTIGAWRDNGDDTHTCMVDYLVEAKDCHLVVSAKDEAGNEARPYEQRGFVIDLTPPRVRILNVPGPHGERAFADEVVPAIVFDDGDDGNFNPGLAGWSYELRGKREGNAAGRGELGRFGQEESVAPGGAEVTFVDFGRDAQSGVGYDVDFDDVYTLTARVRDLAGNEAEAEEVTFSVNRFGSNFFVEKVDGMGAEAAGGRDGAVRPLPKAPQIVVHEVNVSGALSEMDHSVVRDYANAPQELVQDAVGSHPRRDDAGYSLQASSDSSDYNDYAGWSEYVYTIRRGNFGAHAIEGSDGQGLYRVNVASVDAANNENTTSRYWASNAERSDAADKSATVTFTLDELPPQIDDLDLVSGFAVGKEYRATFHVTDDISCGDKVEVFVDGEPVEVFSAGSGQPVDANAITTGTYAFVVPARPFASRSVSVRVTDYDGRVATSGGSMLVTTLVAEVVAVALLVGLGVGAFVVAHRRREAAEPTYPHAM